MLNIIKISGKQGSGKTELLAMIAAGSLGRNYLAVDGRSTADGIAQALRGRRNVALCIDECPAALLEAVKAHPELGRGDRVVRIYAVVEEPQAEIASLQAILAKFVKNFDQHQRSDRSEDDKINNDLLWFEAVDEARKALGLVAP